MMESFWDTKIETEFCRSHSNYITFNFIHTHAPQIAKVKGYRWLNLKFIQGVQGRLL